VFDELKKNELLSLCVHFRLDVVPNMKKQEVRIVEFKQEKLKAKNYRIARENKREERDRQFELEELRLLSKNRDLLLRSEFDAAKNIRQVPKFQEKQLIEIFHNFK
jgi:hypothetical protein